MQRISALPLAPSLLIFLLGFISSVQSHHSDVSNAANVTVLLTSIWAEKSFWVGLGSTVLFAISSIHPVAGAEGACLDYIHHGKTRAPCFFPIKCVQIESPKYFYILATLARLPWRP